MRVIFSICILLVAGLVSVSPVLAQTISTGESPTLQRNQTINGDYFATGDKVVVSGTVNGDAYVAGGTVLIDGTINGDLLVAGGNVTIRGTVTQDVRAAGGNITISSEIGGNTTTMGGSVAITDSATLSGSLVAGVGNLEIFAPVGKGMTIGGGAVQIGNQVGGNIMAGVGEINFSSDAQVQGDITYWSEQQANIAQDASISGQITHHRPPQGTSQATEGAAKALFTGVSFAFTLASFVSALLIGLLLIRFAPRFFDKTAQTIEQKPGASAIIGFMALILIPFAGIFLFVTLLLIPLSVLLMILYFLTLYISKLFIAYAIGRKGAEILNVTWGRGLVFTAGLIMYYAVTSIPVIGWILSFVGMLLGLGALLLTKKDYYKVLADKKIV
ncbi:MAG TPA: hypothetical protein PLD54_01650 [Candidatus Levybacteria bacterium]|nr:hypothetical protein [Candidatus Levybacteria bacterium]